MRIILATTDEELAQCLTVRRIVFIEGQSVPVDLEVDGEDPICQHILALDGTTPIGAARFQYQGDRARIQRVCVLDSHQGTGVGLAIMRFMLDVIRDEGIVRTAKLGSQTHAIPFYERLGFACFGPEYLDADIPHRDMVLHW